MNDLTKDKLAQFAENDELREGVKAYLLQSASVGYEEKATNEQLGERLRAVMQAKEFIKKGFLEIEKLKVSKVEEKPNINTSR